MGKKKIKKQLESYNERIAKNGVFQMERSFDGQFDVYENLNENTKKEEFPFY